MRSIASNFLELRVAGLQRSGNHAIINWILEQHSGSPRCFLNNVAHDGSDPYHSCEHLLVRDISADVHLDQLQSIEKRLLVYSLEDDRRKMQGTVGFVESAFSEEAAVKRRQHTGESQHRIDVLIVRDPFNFFASRLRRLLDLSGTKDIQKIANDWKQTIKTAMQWSAHRSPNRLVISFNRWFSDEPYRRELAGSLFGIFNDRSMGIVEDFGGGSSFDGQAYGRLTPRMLLRKWRSLLHLDKWRNIRHYAQRFLGPDARQMKVLDRWKRMQEDERFCQVFRDPEMAQLSEEFFGELSGTQEFAEQCRCPKT